MLTWRYLASVRVAVLVKESVSGSTEGPLIKLFFPRTKPHAKKNYQEPINLNVILHAKGARSLFMKVAKKRPFVHNQKEENCLSCFLMWLIAL